jgi:hypothetical protein
MRAHRAPYYVNQQPLPHTIWTLVAVNSVDGQQQVVGMLKKAVEGAMWQTPAVTSAQGEDQDDGRWARLDVDLILTSDLGEKVFCGTGRFGGQSGASSRHRGKEAGGKAEHYGQDT